MATPTSTSTISSTSRSRGSPTSTSRCGRCYRPRPPSTCHNRPMDWWQKRPLGRTGITVSRLGLGSSYGVAGRDVDRAVERGINYLYWGSRRRDDFGKAIARAAKRDRAGTCIVVQSYSRSALALGPSLDMALRRLAIDYADILLLGWWNAPPPRRILEAAQRTVEAGKARAVMISCHHRPTFASY